MSLLPELNGDGSIKREKIKYFMPSKTKARQSYFDWNNLLLNRCPSCGEFFPQSNGDRECKNHAGNSIKIPEFKFIKICRDIENKDKFPEFD